MKVWAVAVMMGLAGSGYAQDAAKTQDIPLPKGVTLAMLTPVDEITFDLERVELTPPRWGFEIHRDGTGRYYERDDLKSDGAGNRWQDVRVSDSTMDVLKAGLDRHGDCETSSKNIAQTGKKTLSYWHGDIPWECTFNYSEDAGVMKTANAFQAMAETIQIGAKLAHEHRFDKLALDAEMTSFVDEVKAGRAIEVGNIASTLQSIAEDERVIGRARRQAAWLLEQAGKSAAVKGAGQ